MNKKLVVSVLAVLLLSSCGHSHKYSSNHSSDETNHWYECDCGDKKDISAHTFNDGAITKAATCTESGTKTYTCSVCGYERIETINPTGHSHSSNYSSDEINHWYECDCGDKKDINAHTFNDGNITKAATCTESGAKTYTCSVCGYEKIETINPTGHSYSSNYSSDKTNHWYECDCGDKKDINAHTFDDGVVTKEATFTESGTKLYTCSVCGYEDTRSISKKDIKYTLKCIVDDLNYFNIYVGEDDLSYSIPNNTYDGYTINGWKDSNDNAFSTTGTLNSDKTVYAVLSIDATTTFSQLKSRIEAGRKEVCIANDIVLTDTIYVNNNVTISSSSNVKLTRDVNFKEELFVIGEDASGYNAVFSGQPIEVTIGKKDSSNTITIDGNSSNISDNDVKGTAFFICYSPTVNFENNVSIINCYKTGTNLENSNKYYLSYTNTIGGSAIVNANGVVNLNGLTIDNCKVLTSETTDSYKGGAIFNFSQININDCVISNCEASRGGAIFNYRTMYINAGLFENNSVSDYGGAIYCSDSQYSSIYLGTADATSTVLIFRNNESSKSGGAIFLQTMSSSLIYKGVLFDSNTAENNGGAISSCGDLVIKYANFTNNTVGGRGAAIYQYVSETEYTVRILKIESGEFDNNESASGGAIALFASTSNITDGAIAYINNCTFSNNSALLDSALSNGNGGALYISRKGTAYVDNCVFEDNAADAKGGAIYLSDDALLNINDSSLENNNAAGNGGGIYATKSLIERIEDTVFLNNTSASTTYGGGALYLTDSEATIISATFDGNTSSYNGGAIALYTSSTLTIKSMDAYNNNATNLGGVIYLNTSELDITGTVNDDVYSVNFGKVNNDTSISSNTSIGGGAIYCTAESVINIDKASFIGNTSTQKGGAIQAQGCEVNISNSVFDRNDADSHGGALYVSYVSDGPIYSEVTISDTVFKDNNSGEYGGAVYISQSTVLNTDGVIFTDNISTGNGGAVYLSQSTFNSTDDEYNSNTANSTSYGGGAIYSTGGIININGSDFDGNNALYGGAIAVYSSSTINISKINAINNTSTNKGGVIYSSKSIVNIISDKQNELIFGTENNGNSSSTDGGAIAVNSTSTLNIKNAVFAYNSGSKGGAIYADTSTASIDSTTMKNNAGASGGAIYFVESTSTIVKSTFDSNTATGNGGAIYAYTNSNLTLGSSDDSTKGVTFTNNSTASAKFGGVMYISGAAVANFYNVTATSNSALSGGFIYMTTTNTKVYIHSGSSSNNSATNGPTIYSNSNKAKLYIKGTNTGEYFTYETDGIAGSSTVNDIN